ncbi:MAG: BrnT family toxin [Lysobacteraceae bacterium]
MGHNKCHGNQLRHGQGRKQSRQAWRALSAAVGFEWETALTWLDTRKEYGEERECGIGYIDLTLYFVAFVDRDETRRIISLRKATRQKVKRYAET